jgi:hypothetical protein
MAEERRQLRKVARGRFIKAKWKVNLSDPGPRDCVHSVV